MDNKVQKMLSGSLYALLAVFLAFAVILVLPVYQKYLAKQREVATREKALRKAQEECQALILEVHELDQQKFAAEKIAREKYKKCRTNEQIIIYGNSK